MKFVPSAVGFGSPSGSQGSTTASHNRSGYYLRNRVIPTNPNSARQQAVRSGFGGMIQYWTDILTSAQRMGWKTYADNVQVMDSMGLPIFLTGQNMFVRANTLRMQAAEAVVEDAPTIFDTGASVMHIIDTIAAQTEDVIAILAAGQTLQMTALFTAAIPANGDLLIWIGRPINPSRAFFKGPWQFATLKAVNSGVTSVDLDGDLVNLLMDDPLVVGQYRSLRARVVYDDGRVSQNWDMLLNVVEGEV